MNSLFDAIVTDSGWYNGTVIYGKNSDIIVYIKGKPI